MEQFVDIDLKSCPMILNCLHVYCVKCIDELAKICHKKKVRCPACKFETPLGESDEPEMHLKKFYVAISDLSGNVASRSPLFNRICGECESNSPSWICTSCDPDCNHLCDKCALAHKELKAFRKHELLPLLNRTDDLDNKCSKVTTDNKRQSIDISCLRHRKYLVEAYCITCDEIMCGNCAVFEHKVKYIFILKMN